MKYLLSLLLFFCLSYITTAQTYVSLAPSLTNTPGTLAEKSNVAFEIGRQWDVFSLGVDYGRTVIGRVIGKDTCNYMEIRPNLNIFQVGKFTNTFTAGAGYVFGAKESYMSELTYGIEYALTEKTHFNVYFGQYYFSGRTSASTQTFFGVSVAYYFKPYKTSSVITQSK
jgi:hypothetical protein